MELIVQRVHHALQQLHKRLKRTRMNYGRVIDANPANVETPGIGETIFRSTVDEMLYVIDDQGVIKPIAVAGGGGFRYTEISQTTIDWYVDAVNGDDGNDGDTPLTPFATLAAAKAAALAAVGSQTIYVFEGIYAEDVVLATDSVLDNGLIWYFETGSTMNTNVPFFTDPGAHFFGIPFLQVQGNGRFTYIGSASMIDTTNALFSVVDFQFISLRYIATAGSPRPIVLGDASDNIIQFRLQNDEQGNAGYFGFGSTINLTTSDYFIYSENPQFSKAFDDITIVGGLTQTIIARLMFINSDNPLTIFSFESEAGQAVNTEGVRCEAIELNFTCGFRGGRLNNMPVRALGASAGNAIEVRDQEATEFFGGSWSSELECNQGTIELVGCFKNSGAASSIIITGANSRLNMRDCIIATPSPVVDASDNAGSTINIYDSTLVSSTAAASIMEIESPDTLLLNCKFKSPVIGSLIASSGVPAINISNCICNTAIGAATDPLGGLDVDSAYGDLVVF